MEKKKVVLLGDIPIATKALKLLHKKQNVDIVGVVCKEQKRTYHNDPWDEPFVYDYAKDNNLPIKTVNDLLEKYKKNDLDIAFSCRNSIILRKPFIELFRLGVVNMHAGLLPERRGLNISCHCIIQGDLQGGGTLHYIEDEGIDTGSIIAKNAFEIQNEDNSFSVFQKTQKCLWKAFVENIDSILSGTVKTVPQEEYIARGNCPMYFNRKSLEYYREISLEDMTPEELLRRVRGFDFPGHEPAFTVINGVKVYFTTREFYRTERK